MGHYTGCLMKPILFDLDGTLIDSSPSILKCYEEVLAENHLETKVTLSPRLIGPPLPVTMKQVTGVEEAAQLEHLTNRFKALYDSHVYRETVVYPGVDELLETLTRTGHRLYIATNKRLEPSRKILDYLGWTSQFAAVMGCDSGNPAFTHKTQTLQALVRQEALNPSDCIYIGDRLDDFKAAQDCGMRFLAASWGYCDTDWAQLTPQSLCLKPLGVLNRI